MNGKFSVKVNAPYRQDANFITYRFLKVPGQGEQGLEDLRDPAFSSIFKSLGDLAMKIESVATRRHEFFEFLCFCVVELLHLREPVQFCSVVKQPRIKSEN